jgi:hypothetical protein
MLSHKNPKPKIRPPIGSLRFKDKKTGQQKRDPYFKMYREERDIMKIFADNPPSSINYETKRASYRKLRNFLLLYNSISL